MTRARHTFLKKTVAFTTPDQSCALLEARHAAPHDALA
jgi:hypothetical protein